jgi:hypothetical protein
MQASARTRRPPKDYMWPALDCVQRLCSYEPRTSHDALGYYCPWAVHDRKTSRVVSSLSCFIIPGPMLNMIPSNEYYQMGEGIHIPGLTTKAMHQS